MFHLRLVVSHPKLRNWPSQSEVSNEHFSQRLIVILLKNEIPQQTRPSFWNADFQHTVNTVHAEELLYKYIFLSIPFIQIIHMGV